MEEDYTKKFYAKRLSDMFTQPCFIRKNSKELQERVYRLGGRSGNCIWESEFNKLLVADKDHFRCYDDEWDNADKLVEKVFIDCGTDEHLFIALAALRDDSDYMQYFTNGTDFILCDREDLVDMYSVLCSGAYTTDELDEFHKATPQELIEYFKDK